MPRAVIMTSGDEWKKQCFFDSHPGCWTLLSFYPKRISLFSRSRLGCFSVRDSRNLFILVGWDGGCLGQGYP